ncbi:hypothetical protein M5K25_019679 [Dendrobium thyrsiflorum]|uniref:Uncharacterized protein n=1 Tax=Dendrobium thyrsiflorum TaxID=117978 RepID=A0ABD0UMG0_DENTH
MCSLFSGTYDLHRELVDDCDGLTKPCLRPNVERLLNPPEIRHRIAESPRAELGGVAEGGGEAAG